jgi:hypothetical protein
MTTMCVRTPPLALSLARALSFCVQMFHQLTMLKEVIAAPRPVPPRPPVALALAKVPRRGTWDCARAGAARSYQEPDGEGRQYQGGICGALLCPHVGVWLFGEGQQRSWCLWGRGITCPRHERGRAEAGRRHLCGLYVSRTRFSSRRGLGPSSVSAAREGWGAALERGPVTDREHTTRRLGFRGRALLWM